MRYILAAVLLAFLGAVGVFALQNTQSITVRFAKWSINTPVAFMIVTSYILGMFSGWNVVSFLKHSIHRVTVHERAK